VDDAVSAFFRPASRALRNADWNLFFGGLQSPERVRLRTKWLEIFWAARRQLLALLTISRGRNNIFGYGRRSGRVESASETVTDDPIRLSRIFYKNYLAMPALLDCGRTAIAFIRLNGWSGGPSDHGNAQWPLTE
jgi:hypothetical protein